MPVDMLVLYSNSAEILVDFSCFGPDPFSDTGDSLGIRNAVNEKMFEDAGVNGKLEFIGVQVN